MHLLASRQSFLVHSFCLLLSLASPQVVAQNKVPSFADYRHLIFEQIQPNLIANSKSRDLWKVMQDSHGFLWFSSQAGLHRYDGRHFQLYTHVPGDTTSLPPHRVWEMEEDALGRIWVATDDGLRVFDPHTEQFEKLRWRDSTYLASGITFNITRDQQDRMWVTTRGNGFYVFDQILDTVWHFRHDAADPHSLSDDIVVEVLEDRKGRYWITTMFGGLNRLDSLGGPFTHYLHVPDDPTSVPSNSIMYALEDQNGAIWLTTWNGIGVLDPSSGYVTTYQHDVADSHSLAHNRTWHAAEDGNGHIWIATSGGLSIFDPQKKHFSNYRHDPFNANSLSDNYLRFAYEDHDGNMWLTSANGINKASRQANQFSFQPYRQQPGSSVENPHDGITAILDDSNGRRWVATNGGGIYQMDLADESIRLFLTTDDASSTSIWTIFEDSKDRILAATHAGVMVYNEFAGRFVPLTIGAGGSPFTHSIRDIIEPQPGVLWMVGDEGWFILSEEKGSLDQPDATIDVLTTIFLDQAGRVWLGRQKGVHVRYPDGRVFSFSHDEKDPHSLSNNFITGIVEDTDGVIWVATKHGLNRFSFAGTGNAPRLSRWTMTNSPLTAMQMLDVTLDKNGQMWGLFPQGVTRIDPENRVCQTFSPLPQSDILSSRFGHSRNGRLQVGGYYGVYSFQADSLQSQLTWPPVWITDFRLFNQSVPIRGGFMDTAALESPLMEAVLFTDQLTLKHWQNDFSFVFAALEYSAVEGRQFRYRLDGYDDHWITPSTDFPIAAYTNIPPGNYVFRVILSAMDGNSRSSEDQLQIRIRPPWYWAWWSKLIYGFVLAGILYGGYQVQLKRRLAQVEARRFAELDQFKTQFYTNITHEFRTPLTIILGMAQQMKNQVSEHAKHHLDLIKRNGRQLLQLVNQMLDLSKLEAGHLQLQLVQGDVIAFLRYLIESFQSLAAQKDIALHLQSQVDQLLMDYDPDRLTAIVSNLLANAVKFTPAGGTVDVRIAASPKQLTILVRDSGTGIAAEDLPFIFDRYYQSQSLVFLDHASLSGSGIGLALTKRLVELMGGAIEVQSQLGEGSTFKVELPISRLQPLLATPSPIVMPPVSAPRLRQEYLNSGASDRPLLLLVEDNVDLLHYLVSILADRYQLLTAKDGQEGIDRALNQLPDMIITDVMMPRVNGLELCRRLKNDDLTCHIPIIMLTAKVDTDSRLTGLRQGADAYLAKPFLPEELDICIVKLLQLRSRLQAYYQSQLGASEKDVVKADTVVEDPFLVQVNQLIATHLSDESFSVEFMSSQLFVSVSNLYRKLKALTGMSPKEYLRYHRLNEAKEKLRSTDDSIADVAHQIGFADPLYFSRVFRKEIGMSPSQFRRNSGALDTDLHDLSS